MMLTKAGVPRDDWRIAVAVGVIGVLIIVGALYYSKTQKTVGREDSEEAAPAKAAATPAAPAAAAAKEPKEQPKKKH